MGACSSKETPPKSSSQPVNVPAVQVPNEPTELNDAKITSITTSSTDNGTTAVAKATDAANSVVATATATAANEGDAVKGAVTAAITGVTAHAASTATGADAKVSEAEAVAKEAAESVMNKPKCKVLVLYYSVYGHIYKMALAVAEGARQAGAEVVIKQIPETLSDEILEKMHAAPKSELPVATVSELPEYDAIIFGAGTRFGGTIAQLKAFWDATGQLWQNGALSGKVASTFTSTATLGGGQETTCAVNSTHFAHHGMIFVPMGYGDASLFNVSEVHGGSPWGAGTIAGPDGSRQPTELELGLAKYQGKRVSEVALALKIGRS